MPEGYYSADRYNGLDDFSPACRLRTALGEAEKAFYATLSSYTLADLVRPASARQTAHG